MILSSLNMAARKYVNVIDCSWGIVNLLEQCLGTSHICLVKFIEEFSLWGRAKAFRSEFIFE